MSSISDILVLETTINYRFSDRDLFAQALTHMSAIASCQMRTASNQRLEFLGDRVLALVIADMLVSTFSEADEGELARRLNQLVRTETCADVARDINLGRYLVLGDGESRSGGRQKKAILADTCEALIAAIYCDGGIEAARRFIEDNWCRRMLEWSGPLRDAKTALQEWSHARGSGTPIYKEVGRMGPAHAPFFEISVTVDNLTPEIGEGSSKREAEQNAADRLLVREDGWLELKS